MAQHEPTQARPVSLEVKEEIVLLFLKEGEVVAMERKNGHNPIQRYMTSQPNWGNTIDLFGARMKAPLTPID
jgi:hypothetical protein